MNKKHIKSVTDKKGKIVKVYTVNGTYVRDKLSIHFVAGGHHHVGEHYHYIPDNQIWLEECMTEKDIESTLLHEFHEYNNMKYSKLSYSKAHDLANKAEKKFRKEYKTDSPKQFIESLILNTGNYDISRVKQNRKKDTIWSAISYLRNGEKSDTKIGTAKEIRRSQEEKLKEFAVKNNLWFNIASLNESLYLSEGAEQKVYYLDKKYIAKLNDGIFYESWIDYLNSLLLHNYFFENTKYELLGFCLKENVFYFVVKQPFVLMTEKTDLSKVKSFMAENGFKNTKNNDYYNPELNLILEDLHDENVLTRKGTLFFIDTVFYIKKAEKMEQGGSIPQRYIDMGFYKVGEKKQSTNPEKKWMVLAKKGDSYKVIHGGYKGMEDFTQHKDEARRDRFWKRMGGYNSDKTKDEFSPLYWHKKFETWEDGGQIKTTLLLQFDENNIEEHNFSNFIKKRFAKSGISTMQYKGLNIKITSNKSPYESSSMDIWIGERRSQGGTKFIGFNKKYDKIEDVVIESIDAVKEIYNNFISSIDRKIQINYKIDSGAKFFDNYEMKSLLKESLTNWIGKETNALSGSDYINFAGHKLRFSDHQRPYNSKWNFIHGENHIDVPNGLFTKNEILLYIDNLTDNLLREKDKLNISDYFDKMPVPKKENIEYIIVKKGESPIMQQGGNVDCDEGCEVSGKSHLQGGEKFKIKGTDKIVELEAQEVVINKKAVQDNTVHTYMGTNKEILNKINISTGGNPIMEDGGKVMRSGGKVDIYEGKRRYADKKMQENKNIGTLTEEQHDAISSLCSVRHDLHSSQDSVIRSDSDGKKKKLIKVNIELQESGLNPMSFVPTETSDYIDIDSIDELYEMEEVPEDEKEKQDWYDDNYYRISNELENLNTKIENYLGEIDEKYGTSYNPTGLSRIMEDGGAVMSDGGTIQSKCPIDTKIQTVLIDKNNFRLSGARKWLKEHDFKYKGVDETDNYYRFRQIEPSEFNKDSFRTIELTDGVKAVVGCPIKRMEQGGSVDSEIQTIDFYRAFKSGDTYTEELYFGIDKDSAISEANDVQSESKYINEVSIVEMRTDTYKFVGDTEYYELKDYPLSENYKDSDLWELIKEGEWEEIETFDLVATEKTAIDLMFEVFYLLKSKYGRNDYSSYDSIILGYDKDENDITLQIRVKDHSENPANKSGGNDYYLSIVVANKNETRARFHSSTELYYDGDSEIDDIDLDIYNYIQEIIDYDENIVILSEKLIEVGHKLNTMAKGGTVPESLEDFLNNELKKL
ncbi:MAG: hypothetical protein WCT77_01645 [Bacteroidota bacterium]